MSAKATIVKKMEFEAAHFLPESSYQGPCNSVHGHSYKILVAITGKIDPSTGMVIDFSILKRAVKTCINELDHKLLNDIICNPTAENIVLWIWKHMVKYDLMKTSTWYRISYVELWETSSCSCVIKREHIEDLIGEWKLEYSREKDEC